MYEISVEDTFDAAHCLREYEGSCRQLHGHTYRVCAAFRYNDVEKTGMAFDFKLAKKELRTALDYLDHKYINELPEFSVKNPTAENIAKFVYDRIKKSISHLHHVSVWETPTSCATYFEAD